MALRPFCVDNASKRGQKLKTQVQSGSKNRHFSKDRPFTSRGLFNWKSAFLTGRVLQIVSMFLQNWPIRWFQVIADALTVAPKNRVRGTSTQWQNSQKSVRRRRRRRTYFRQRFLSVAHTKCPSGKNKYRIRTISSKDLKCCETRWKFLKWWGSRNSID